MDTRACVICGTSIMDRRSHAVVCRNQTCINRRKTLLFKQNNPDRYRARRLARNGRQRTRNQQWLNEYKVSRGCADCGFREHPAALQLDHEGPKTGNVSELKKSLNKMIAEIETGQCVVRCANCHAIKTAERRTGNGTD